FSRRIAPRASPVRDLAGALRDFVAWLDGACGVPITAVIGPLGEVDADAALALYRIAEEALANAVRHSGAHRVALALRRTRRVLRLTIADDGHGLPRPLPGGGSGIGNMRERIARVGGHLAITSDAHGTRVVAA